MYLLEGTYNISDTTKVPSDVSIIGQGAGAVMFVINSSPLTTGVISNADDIGGNSRILIKNLRIDGNKDNNTNNNQCGIYFRNVNESLIANFWIENTKAQSIRFYGQVGHACDNNIISENMISKNTVGSLGYANILLQNFLRGIVSKNIFTADSPNTYGISLVSAKNITVAGNYIAPAHGSGIGQQSSSDNIIVGNKVVVSDAYNVAFNSRCVVAGNNLENEATTGTAIIDNQGPLNSVISDSIIQSSFEGIRLISKRHNISGNIDVISGNSHGIYLSAAGANTSKCNLISSNYIYKSSGVGTTYGVYIWLTSASNNYLVGNLIGGAFTAYIQDNGTSTFYTDKLKITLQKGEYTGLENGGTLTPSGPASYLRLNPASNITLGNPAIADGKTGGDILILENTSDTYTIMINDNNNVQLHINPLTLDKNDTLTLIWDGNDWIETGYSNN
ncbi:MAG TPA: hypothetical protein ENI31_04425 [Candidatus Omnitrophica bacterium]|nr:hypothetical protein [Candidatus Omnitrophota bacterium]